MSKYLQIRRLSAIALPLTYRPYFAREAGIRALRRFCDYKKLYLPFISFFYASDSWPRESIIILSFFSLYTTSRALSIKNRLKNIKNTKVLNNITEITFKGLILPINFILKIKKRYAAKTYRFSYILTCYKS